MIYLDNAATTLLKPAAVREAMNRAMAECASPGRGVHAPAMRAADVLFDAREEAASLFHMKNPEGVVFTCNATHALNIAIGSLVRPGMRVVVSGWEHNAVMRPLYARSAEIDIAAAPLFDKEATVAAFEKKIPGADAVICTHVSNVFGFRLPIEKIAAICRAWNVPWIVDASQSAGTLDLDIPALGASFAAMPGHKGLYGPQGTGILLCRDSGQPLLYGGTGGRSENTDMPEELPDRLEAGTPNVCGVAGLGEGLRFIRWQSTEMILRQERRLARRLTKGLSSLRGLKIFAGPEESQTGVLSVIPTTMSCEELAEQLGEEDIAVRAGLHCAPLAHRSAGTLETGTVRLSVSCFNTETEIDCAVETTEKILKKSLQTVTKTLLS